MKKKAYEYAKMIVEKKEARIKEGQKNERNIQTF